MTCIVWDKVTLAADSRVTMGTQLINDSTMKLFQPKAKYRGSDILAVGVAGNASALQGMEDWLNEGSDTSTFNTLVGEWACQAIIITREDVWFMSAEPKPVRTTGSFAIGSGGLMAIAAIKHGSNAKDAVKFAIENDIACGGMVHTIRCREDDGQQLPTTAMLPTVESFEVAA